MIDPAETRLYIVRFIEAAWPSLKTRLGTARGSETLPGIVGGRAPSRSAR